ncbi:MAG: hypothetical protein AAGK78_06690, partial [Planctomycetota bacterium]
DPQGQWQRSTSTLTRVPLLAGNLLSAEVRNSLVNDLSLDGPFATKWGVATEAVDSPHYLDDGYWRGPIWAPQLYMLFEGLRRCDAIDTARELATRFCDLCTQEPVAMHENFDAWAGRGLRSPSYSWTAAVFLRLATWLSK